MPPDFEQLVRQHGGRIRRIAQRYGAPAGVDDLFQEILMQLWKSRASFRGESKIETWIYGIAINTAMTHLRKTGKEREMKSKLHSVATTSELQNQHTSQADILEDFLNSLNEIDASILMMYLDGLSARDMERALGVSGNSIRVRINRMKQKFSATYVDS